MDFPKFNQMTTPVATAAPYVAQTITVLNATSEVNDWDIVFVLYLLSN